MPGKPPVSRPALWSIVVSGALVLIAVIRILSYSRSTIFGELARNAPLLSFFSYEPGNYLNVQFLKIVATPSLVAMQYFIFRALNWSHTRKLTDPDQAAARRLDFRSPWLRLLLTSLVTLHWVFIEAAKFSNPDDFYPYSELESRGLNMAVLLSSQLIAFLGMKYLSFEPLFRRRPASA